MSYTLKLMRLNLKALYFSGIYYYKETNKIISWKFGMYNIYQVILYILYVPTLTGQILALYHYWGDLEKVLDNLGVIGIAASGYIAPLFINWNEVHKLIYNLETNSIFTIPKIQEDSKKMAIVKETQRIAHYLSLIMYISAIFVGISWISEPFIFKLLDDLTENYDSEGNSNSSTTDTNELALKEFPVKMWLPVDITVNPLYMIMYMVVSSNVMTIGCKVSALLSFCISIVMHTSALFKILTIELKDINNNVTGTERNVTAGRSYERNNSPTKFNYKVSSIPFKNTNLQKSQYKSTHNEVKSYFTNMSTQKNFGPIISISNEENIQVFEEDELTVEALQETIIMKHLADSIRDHQEIIRFLAEVNNVSRRCYLVLQILATYIFSLELFQMAMNIGFGSNLKHGAIALFILIFGYILCWFGDDLKTQSSAVQEAAYDIPWYNHSTKFKKTLQLLIMRAQIPCCIEMGPFNNMTVEHYSNLVNMAYTYFTLLLQLEK